MEAATHTEYDDNSNMTKFTDERTHDWVSTYTVRDRLLTSTNPEGTRPPTLHRRHAGGHGYQRQQPRHDHQLRDVLRRVDQVIDDDGFFKRFEYDFNGNRTRLEDESGRIVTWEYDGLNRQTKQSADPTGLNLITLTAYDVTPGVVGQTSTTTSPASQWSREGEAGPTRASSTATPPRSPTPMTW